MASGEKSRKRSYEEISRFDAVEDPVMNASIHVAVTDVSSVKKGRTSEGDKMEVMLKQIY